MSLKMLGLFTGEIYKQQAVMPSCQLSRFKASLAIFVALLAYTNI